MVQPMQKIELLPLPCTPIMISILIIPSPMTTVSPPVLMSMRFFNLPAVEDISISTTGIVEYRARCGISLHFPLLASYEL